MFTKCSKVESMAKLQNIKHESFAYYVAQGFPKYKAYKLAGYTSDSRGNAIALWRHKGKTSQNIQRRTFEILGDKMKASDLSRDDILNQIFETRELAKDSGQHSASLKASEMLGREMYKMFTERKETLSISLQSQNIGNIDQYLRDKYGDRAEALIAWLRRDRTQENSGNNESGSRGDSGPGEGLDSVRKSQPLQLVYDADSEE